MTPLDATSLPPPAAEELHERIVKKGGIKSLLRLLTSSQDAEAQRFSALAMANCASVGVRLLH